jgi:hypothetical protein
MINEHDRVVLTSAIASEGLEAGDVGTVIHIHVGNGAYEVEFLTLSGATAVIATVPSGSLRAVRPNEIANARTLTAA